MTERDTRQTSPRSRRWPVGRADLALSVCRGGLLSRGPNDERVCVFVVADRLVHEQFPDCVTVLRDRNEGGCLLVVRHRSLYEHRRDLVPIRSENDKLQASGILEVVRRFGTCRDHRWGSSLLVTSPARRPTPSRARARRGRTWRARRGSSTPAHATYGRPIPCRIPRRFS